MRDLFGLNGMMLSKFERAKDFKWYCKKRKQEWRREREGGEMSLEDYKRIYKDEWEAERVRD